MAMPQQRRSPSPGSEMPACNPRTPSFRRSGPNPSARTSVRIGNTPKLFVPGLLDSLGILPRVQSRTKPSPSGSPRQLLLSSPDGPYPPDTPATPPNIHSPLQP